MLRVGQAGGSTLTEVKRLLRGLVSAPEAALVRWVRLHNRFPPLFIVGPPRSGTTITYLHLFNTFRFAYLPNVSRWFPSATATSSAVGRLLFSYKPTYESTYGVVPGPMAPCAGWRLFHRWFPEHDHSQPVRSDRLYELRNIVRLQEMVFGAPFAVKNNNNSTRIDYLAQVFPRALFVHVKRDIVDTTLSLLEARRDYGIGLNEWWSVAPPTIYNETFTSEVEQAVMALWETNKCIERSLDQITRDRWCVIGYENFCSDPSRLERWVETAYAATGTVLQRRDATTSPAFETRHRDPASAMEERIMTLQSRLAAGALSKRGSHECG